MVVYGAWLAASGSSPESVRDAFSTENPDAFFTVAMLVTGGAGSMLGGYLCARIAKHAEYRLGAILLAISLVSGWMLTTNEAMALILMSTIVTVAMTFAGVWLGVRRNRGVR